MKPLRLSGSRGVIRANNSTEFVVACNRLKRLLISEGNSVLENSMLVEEFIPGYEVALEGMLTNGWLKVLALFDKPDPLDGPFFEETIYTTPSRLPAGVQEDVTRCVATAAASLGLEKGRYTRNYVSMSKDPQCQDCRTLDWWTLLDYPGVWFWYVPRGTDSTSRNWAGNHLY